MIEREEVKLGKLTIVIGKSVMDFFYDGEYICLPNNVIENLRNWLNENKK